MTTLTVVEQITFGGLDLASYATVLSNLAGWDEFPPLRGENKALTGVTGRQFLRRVFDERKPAVGLIVTPLAADGTPPGTGRVGTRANLDALYAVFGRRTQQALTRKMPDATVRSAQATVFSVGQFADPVFGHVFALLATFEMADPFFYGAAVVDAARAVSASPTSFSVTNPGSGPDGNRVTFDFLGPITNPRVTNQTTGTYVEVDVVVPAGQHLLVDCYAYTATLNGVSVNGSVVHAGAPAFLTLAPGANALVVTSPAPAGSLTTTMLPAYL